jgi:hypothetical protein
LYGYDQANGHQKMYHWKLYGKQALRDLIVQLLPYLLIKKAAANTVLEYMDLGSEPNQEERLRIAEKIKKVNSNNHLTTDTRSMSKRESMAYLAGIVDTEGAIGIRDNKGEAFGAYVMINSTNESLIKWIESLFEGKVSKHEYLAATNRDNNLWALYGKQNIENFILAILPYLVIKKEIANIVLQFVRLKNTWNKEERTRLFQTIRTLQVRCSIPTTNVPDGILTPKIESDLDCEVESAPLVTATA